MIFTGISADCLLSKDSTFPSPTMHFCYNILLLILVRSKHPGRLLHRQWPGWCSEEMQGRWEEPPTQRQAKRALYFSRHRKWYVSLERNFLKNKEALSFVSVRWRNHSDSSLYSLNQEAAASLLGALKIPWSNFAFCTVLGDLQSSWQMVMAIPWVLYYWGRQLYSQLRVRLSSGFSRAQMDTPSQHNFVSQVIIIYMLFVTTVSLEVSRGCWRALGKISVGEGVVRIITGAKC